MKTTLPKVPRLSAALLAAFLLVGMTPASAHGHGGGHHSGGYHARSHYGYSHYGSYSGRGTHHAHRPKHYSYRSADAGFGSTTHYSHAPRGTAWATKFAPTTGTHRSFQAKKEFWRESGHPHGWPGHVVDHRIPLACGGADAPSNMQWQTIAEAHAKDRIERRGCGHRRR